MHFKEVLLYPGHRDKALFPSMTGGLCPARRETVTACVLSPSSSVDGWADRWRLTAIVSIENSG